jgi:hypothetical protein
MRTTISRLKLTMGHLPGWDNLTATTAIHRFFELGGIVVLAILVLFESIAYLYGHHKEALEVVLSEATRQAELTSQKDTFDADLAKAKLEAQKQIEASDTKAKERLNEADKQITALKVKQAPRRLNETQKTAIFVAAKAFPTQSFSVIYSNSAESDAQQFAKDFDDVLGKAWKRTKTVDFNNFVPSPVGVWVCVNPAYANPGALMPPPGARPLAEALFKLGLYGDDSKLHTMNNMELGAVWVVIGSRPVAPN